MTGQSFETTVSEKEKKQLLEKLAQFRGSLSIKSSKGNFDLKVKEFKSDALILDPPNEVLTQELSGTATVNFVVDLTMYRSVANLKIDSNGKIYLFFPHEMFRVQRRSNFRASLPNFWKRRIFVDQVENDRENIEGEVIDISLGGCFFITKNPGSMVSDDNIYGEIEIHDFNLIRFKANVRRTNSRPDGTAFGIEFTEIDGLGTQVLNAITLRASREMRNYDS